MRIENISADVRIITYANPFDTVHDVRVEALDVDGEWHTYWETSSLSNDFAYTQAQDIARSAVKVVAAIRQALAQR